MRINIRTKGSVKMSDNVKEHINKQVMELDKLFNESEHINVNILCAEKGGKNSTEITIVLKQVILRAECKGDTLYAAINQAVDKIEQQLIRYKKKVNAFIKKREGISEYFLEKAEEKDQVVEKSETIRVKQVELTQMSVDEAITQMELLDHKFYLFKNEENNHVAVVYKRDNGGYGLLESLD